MRGMSPTPLRPVSARGIAAEAADTIREAIMDGTFAPGEALREGPLGESLEVSRGSVREALALLEREGIIRTGWHRPAAVVPVTRERAEHLYRLRAGLERIAARGAMPYAHEEDFAAAISDLEAAVNPGTSRSDVVRADLAFHDRVYEIADNEPLTEAWRAIRSQVRLYQLLRTSEPEPGYDAGLPADHRSYVAALCSGDPERAGRVAEEHIEAALHGLLQRLEDPSHP